MRFPIRVARGLPGVTLLLLAAGPVAAAPIAPTRMPLELGPPVLDQQCVDRIKAKGGSAGKAAHECRKPYEPGPTPGPMQHQDAPAQPPPPSSPSP
jgi:hypothetical protein